MAITFNSYSLSSSYILVNRINKSDAPSRDIQQENKSFDDGFSIVSDFWRSRKIVIAGTLDATSSGHLGDLLDTLKQNLSPKNKNLDVDYGSGTRRYKATLVGLEAPEEFYHITHLPFTAEFLCDPFGYGTQAITFTSNDITASSDNESITFSGTYNPQPIITLNFTSATDATAVSLTNNTTGDTITITHAIATSSVIIINTETQQVTYNGTQVDFDGPIPSFDVGENSITIAVASTARDYDLSVSYIPRYL